MNNSKLTTPTLGNQEEQIAIIGASFQIKGDISGEGAIILSGKVEGNITASQLVIEKNASITGNIVCVEIDVSGRVRGQIEASSVVIRENAAIDGDITYSTLTIEGGSTISGLLKKTSTKLPPSQQAAMRANEKPEDSKITTQIDFPEDLILKLLNNQSRDGAHISLIDGGPAPAWIKLTQDKLALLVDCIQLQKLKDERRKIEIRLHVATQYFDITIPS